MKNIILFCIICITSSCTSLLLNSSLKDMGAFNEKVQTHHLSNGEKDIVFVNMHHIGRKEFYQDVATTVDSLQKANYVVFYESVIQESNTDSLENDMHQRKIRKIIGFIPDEHLDTINNQLFGKYTYSGKYDLINQPSYPNLKVDTSKAVKADVSISTLITEFEKKHAPITLDTCDMQTSLESTTYPCKQVKKSTRKEFFDQFIIDYRNTHLASLIHQHPSSKIAVIFGKAHLPGMVVQLRTLDSNWKYQ